jgi:arylsulfatase A-like enzyme
MIRWPGVTRAGTVLDQPIITMDFFATVLSAAGVPPDPTLPADGHDLTPLLRGETLPERPLFWHYPHYSNQGGSPGAAIRKGDWKLIEWFEGRTELYNLADDPGEKTNLADRDPDRVRAMRAELAAWQTQTGAKFPTPRNADRKAP